MKSYKLLLYVPIDQPTHFYLDKLANSMFTLDHQWEPSFNNEIL